MKYFAILVILCKLVKVNRFSYGRAQPIKGFGRHIEQQGEFKLSLGKSQHGCSRNRG